MPKHTIKICVHLLFLFFICLPATSYDVRIGTDDIALETNFAAGNKLNNSDTWQPLESGQTETRDIVLSVFQADAILYIAVKAVDDAGKYGEISNIVKIVLGKQVGTTTRVPSKTSMWLYVYIAFGVVCLLLLVIIVLLVYWKCFRQNATPVAQTPEPIPEPELVQSPPSPPTRQRRAPPPPPSDPTPSRQPTPPQQARPWRMGIHVMVDTPQRGDFYKESVT